ncbi:sulfotransferase [Parasedimentitalea marina]|nr:sulfotransferase [Parasedimentitalea marina]
MKAGTTWLYSVLNRHPELHFSLEKEIHYFYHKYVDTTFLNEPKRLANAKDRYMFRFNPEKANVDRVRENLHWVSSYLNRPVDDFWFRNLFHMRPHQTWACEFSNLNAHLPPEAWGQIAAQCDNLRVLYTMRDPVKRLWSHTKFHLQMTGRTDKLETWGPREFEKFMRQPHIWDNAEYGRVLRNLKPQLPAENVKVIFYEDIHADQRGMLKGIEDFLGVEHFNYPQKQLDARPTEGVKRSMPEFFTELVAKDVDRIKTEIRAEGYQIPDSWL